MTAVHAFAFTCDSRDGCLAHAVVAGDDPATCRDTLTAALGWFSSEHCDLCPEHRDQPL